jgi:hypothetical protein
MGDGFATLLSRSWFDQPASHGCAMVCVMTNWIEHVRCPRCDKRGDAELIEIGQFKNGFKKVPEGFMVVFGEYGGEFYCVNCRIPVIP